MTRLLPVALAALAVVGTGREVRALEDLYPQAALAADRARFEQRVATMFEHGLWDFMDRSEKLALADVRLRFPLAGRHPLDVYAYDDGSGPVVELPVLSLKFIEDLSTAYAWRHLNGFSLEPIDEYVAMLRYRSPSDFPGGRPPDPLTALGVPPGILHQDSGIDDLSLRFRNSAWAFILAHELGHLLHDHPGNAAVDPATSQRHESEADRFALDLLSRSDTIPMGMILWFQASMGFFPNRADFESEAEFMGWQSGSATHPMNPGRMQAMALALERSAEAALDPARAEILRYIASRLAGMAEILAEPDMQRLMARKAVLGDAADLRRR
jgi:hypothetical protein